jgi:hypothetical protein
MKTLLLATTLTLFMAGAASADQIADAEVQNLQNAAQTAYANADVADARGDHLGAARWRQQAKAFEQKAQNLQSQNQAVANGVNAIAGAIQGDNQ